MVVKSRHWHRKEWHLPAWHALLFVDMYWLKDRGGDVFLKFYPTLVWKNKNQTRMLLTLDVADSLSIFFEWSWLANFDTYAFFLRWVWSERQNTLKLLNLSCYSEPVACCCSVTLSTGDGIADLDHVFIINMPLFSTDIETPCLVINSTPQSLRFWAQGTWIVIA